MLHLAPLGSSKLLRPPGACRGGPSLLLCAIARATQALSARRSARPSSPLNLGRPTVFTCGPHLAQLRAYGLKLAVHRLLDTLAQCFGHLLLAAPCIPVRIASAARCRHITPPPAHSTLPTRILHHGCAVVGTAGGAVAQESGCFEQQACQQPARGDVARDHGRGPVGPVLQ
jgi:hypothetical protein